MEEPASNPTMSAGEVGEDVPDDDGEPSLEEALARLGLTSLSEAFQREQIDFDSLVSECTMEQCPDPAVLLTTILFLFVS